MEQLRSIHIFIAIADTAQATVDIEPGRIYFALATSDTMDQGSVKSDPGLMEAVAAALSTQAARSLPADTTLKVAFDFADGSRRNEPTASFGIGNLNSAIALLTACSIHLEFLSGFAV